MEVVSRRLGHANVSVTLNIYAHFTDADDEATADRVATRILEGNKRVATGADPTL